MKRIYLLALLCCASVLGFAQTFVISPTGEGGFETGTDFPTNGWTVVNGTNNQWAVGNAAGAVFAGSRAAYIGTPTSWVGSNNVSVSHFYRDVTIPVGATSVFLSFQYIQPLVDNTFDYFYVFTTTPANTPVAGTIPGVGYTQQFMNTATAYGSYTNIGPLNLTALAGTTIRLVFTRRCDAANPIAIPAVDNISLSYIPGVACSGTPTPGTVAATQSTGCSAYTTTLSLSGSSVNTGIEYQWESSPDNSAWTPVAGATNPTYSTTIASSIYYRCNLTCTGFGSTISTPGFQLTLTGPSTATLPFFEGFESSWINACNIADVPNNFWRNVPPTGNNSWRRDDDAPGPNTAVWTSPTLYAYSPGGAASSRSARFHQGFTTTGGQGRLDLYVNLPVGTKQITYDHISGSATTGANNSVQLQVSTDNGVTFTNIGTPYNGTAGAWTTRTETTTIASPNAILRWLTTSDFGSFDIGIDNVSVYELLPCTTPPNQPTVLSLTPGLFNVAGSFTASAPAADKYLVVMTTTATAPTAPTDGVNYVVGSTTLGGTVVSNTNSTTFNATGLTPGTQYWFWVYGYNGLCTGGPLYSPAAPLANNTITTTCSLSGIRTVGPTGDYPTLTAALNAVMTAGLSAPLALELQTTYTGAGETVPIVINTPPCASNTNRLTIRPQGTMTITYGAGTQPFLDLNGADFVTIDGRVGSTGTTKDLTILNTNTGGQSIRFINGATNNIVRYCNIRGVTTSTAQGVVFFFTSNATTGNSNNLIEYCDIGDGATTPTNCIYSTGTTGKENANNTISNCNIFNYFLATGADNGIFLTTASTGWTIDNNRFYQTATRTYTTGTTHRAIQIGNTAGNGFTVTNNIIGYANSAGTGTYTIAGAVTNVFMGITLSVGNAIPTSVQGNTISGINLTTTSTAATVGGALCGISITAGSANIGNITPNVIGAATGNGAITATVNTSTGGTIVGINASAVNPASINIQNNIIGGLTLTNGSATLGGGIQGIQISSTGSYSVTGNTIGSTSTTNSLLLQTATTGTQLLYGINSAATTTNIVQPLIQNNTIANLTALGTGTASLAAGILHTGAASATISGNNIYNISSSTANTIITGQTGVCGIAYTGGTGSAAITQNTVNNVANTNAAAVLTNVAGISLANSVSPQITRNMIYNLRNANTGITATNPPKAIGILVVSATTNATLANNMISLGNAQTTNTSFVGIMNSTSTVQLNFYHNTVNIEGTASSGALSSACFHRGSFAAALTTPVDIRNNIFQNSRTGGTGKHYAIANAMGGSSGTSTGWGTNASNFNILNSAIASTVGLWANADQTFATWQAVSASDANSYTLSPITFASSATGDLHVNMGVTANNAESHGTTIAGLNTDYDNDTRPGPVGSVNGGAFAPDLGADEFDGVALSNLPPVITYTALTNSCGTGDRILTATITDGDVIPTTGALQPRIYFKNGAGGTWFSTQGTLASGSGSSGIWNFTISSSLMGGIALNDQIFYYVIAQDGASQMSATPGAGLVATDVNNISTHPTTPNSYTVLLSLGGTIPVGSASATPFNTITSAVAAYNGGCLSGPVVFELTDALYPSETFPISIGLNSFASATNTLTIRPAAGVAVNINGLAASTAMFKFLNARYVTLDGVNSGGSSLSLNNNNTGTSATVWFAATNVAGMGNKFVTVKNTNIVGGTNAIGSTASWGFLSSLDGVNANTTSGPDNDNITIENNTVTRVAYGIYAFGTAFSSTGGLDNWVINGNTFGPAINDPAANIMYNGMFMGSHMNPSITNNTVQNIGSTGLSSQVVGIFITGLVNGANISGNTVRNIVSNSCSSGTGANFGIGIGSNNIILNCSVTRNVISGISNSNTGGCGRSTGIMINTSSGTSNTLIANNMISDIRSVSWGSATPSPLYMPAGIDIQGTSGGVRIYYNTVNMNSVLAAFNAPTASACLLMNNSTGSGIDIRNNIFNNTYDNTTVTTDRNYAIYSAVAASNISNINYNSYNVVSPNPMGYLGGFLADLAAMQSTFGGDANTVTVAPQFISASDLHLVASAGNLPLIAGTPAVNGTVGTDFDGTTRSGTNPVIGAHEVTIVNCSGAVAGTATAAIPTFCGSGITTIITSGTTQGLGVSYQWQTSTDSASWTNISGATGLSYALPSSISNTTWYRIKVGCSFSSTFDSATAKVTINPFPAAITGQNVVCINATYNLASSTPGGTWSSSNPAVATVNTATGEVTTTALGGSSIISYTFATGCRVTSTLTVNSVYPVVSASASPSTVCELGTSSLTGVTTNPGATAYTLATISYAPVAFTPTGTFNSSTPSLPSNSLDDGYYSVPLPFNFPFYGTTYTAGTNVHIGINGYLTFGTGVTNTYINTIPNTAFPATISVLGRDMIISASGSITYGTTGTAPNRQFVVSYNNVPDFSTGLIENAQMVLFENTGNIEFHVTNAAASQHSLGIQSAAGAASAFVPGQNNSSTPIVNGAYRFIMPVPTYTWSADPSLSATNILAPTASPITGTTTYTLTVTASNGCVSSATTTVTTNAIPAPIVGSTQVCEGLTTTLSNPDAGGTWISGSTAVATIGSTSGVVFGVSAGTVQMSYAYTGGLGCARVQTFTVNPLPAAIGGTNSVCINSTATLTNADAGGTWLSANTAIVTVGSSTGMLTGITDGTTRITYTLPTGCITSAIATVYPLPIVSVTPTTPTTFCIGESTSVYSVSATMPVATLLSQNFNGTLGAWSLDNTLGSVGVWSIVPTGFDGTPGDGSAMAQASAFVEGNQVITKLVSPTFSTTGYESASLTFNQYLLSDVSDQALSVEYSVNNGPWVSMVDYVATTIFGSGVWSAATPDVTIALPPAVINQPNVKLRWYYNGALYGWFIDNIKVTGTLPAPTYTWSGGSDLSCNTCTNPTITPSASGVNIYTATATSAVGCASGAPVTINVNPLPAVIGGDLAICAGLTGTLTNADAGGTWVSANTAVATIDGTTGVATALVAGTSDITYTLPTGCIRTAVLTVNALPADITGTQVVCEGLTTTLVDATAGGTWTSSDNAIADVDAGGVVTGILAGNATITYTLTATGCIKTAVMTVNPLPAAIGGNLAVCEGLTTTLSNTSTGGTWVSSNTSVATIDGTTGVATAIVAGNTTITYTLPTGCIMTAELTVNPLPDVITGTMNVCEGLTTALGQTTGGGTWTSSNIAAATVDASGVVTGVAAGSTTITYTITATGCIRTTNIVVNPLPAVIGGNLAVCEGLTTTLTNTSTGGTWISNLPSVATIGLSSGIATGVVAGNAMITYTLPTGCIREAELTVNPLPDAITGTTVVCQGLTTTLNQTTVGGTWTSGNSTIASVDAAGVVTGVAAGNTNITYTITATGCIQSVGYTVNPLPAAIDGTLDVCEGLTRTLTNTVSGGTWSSSNTSVATIGSISGIVTGNLAGNATITYMLPTGCISTAEMTVNPLPAPIAGLQVVCEASTVTLTNATAGGSWSSSNTALASVDAGGVVTGVSAGNPVITYMLPTGCISTTDMTINALPASLTGIQDVCEGLTTTLSSATSGGIWSSGSTFTATVGATSGLVTGVSAGNVDITYTLATSCYRVANVTVNALPAVISGATQVCEASSTTLTNADAGGTWSSSNTSVAAVVGTTGVVTGVAAGSVVLTYTLPTGCIRTHNMNVNALPLVYNVTGGGSYCFGGSGVSIGVNNTESGTAYNLYLGSTLMNSFTAAGGATNFSSMTAAGTYTVQAVSPASCVRAMSGDATVVILPLITPSVTLGSTPNDTVCAGTSTTFTATASNAGTTPTYTWEVNSASVTTTGSAHTYTPTNGDVITVTVTSSEACPSPASVSASQTMVIVSNETPVASIAAQMGTMTLTSDDTVCQGSIVTYSATSLFGGTSPSYTWYRNGIATSATGDTYVYAPGKGDKITVRLNSNYRCPVVNNVTSNEIAIKVDSVYIPLVDIRINTSLTVKPGMPVTFTATVMEGGPKPTFQWYRNSSLLVGASSNVFTTSTIANNDSFSVVVYGTGDCSFYTYNSIKMRLTNAVEDVADASEIRMIPNPTSGEFVVSGTLSTSETKEVAIEVIDMLGQVVYKGTSVAKAGQLNARVKLSNNLANGMYMLNVHNGEESKVFHFVLKQ